MYKLLRVSKITKANSLPWEKSTIYKIHHLNKYPKLFIKVGGALFIDLDVLDEIIENGRITK